MNECKIKEISITDTGLIDYFKIGRDVFKVYYPQGRLPGPNRQDFSVSLDKWTDCGWQLIGKFTKDLRTSPADAIVRVADLKSGVRDYAKNFASSCI